VKKTDTSKKYDPSEDQYLLGFQAGVKATEAKNLLSKDKTNDTDLNERILKGTTIHQACEEGNLERMLELIRILPDLKTKNDERGWSPIHISGAYGHIDLVKHLCVMGIDLKEATPTGYNPIHLASMNGHVNCIMILSAMGCPISSRTIDEQTPLHLACMSGHIECIKWLLSNRARINVREKFGNNHLMHSMCPLMQAKCRGVCSSIVRLLIGQPIAERIMIQFT
jgi:ankyrin repeat protein